MMSDFNHELFESESFKHGFIEEEPPCPTLLEHVWVPVAYLPLVTVLREVFKCYRCSSVCRIIFYLDSYNTWHEIARFYSPTKVEDGP
jgi:hypothetical protein